MKYLYKSFLILFMLSLILHAQDNVEKINFTVKQHIKKDGTIIYTRVPKHNFPQKEQTANSKLNGVDDINTGPYLPLENFEDPSFPPASWDIVTDNLDWEQTDLEFNSEFNSAAINLNCETYNDAWLITPEIDLSAAIGPSLTYYEYVEIADVLEGEHLVLISTDYDGSGDPNAFTWNELSFDILNFYSWELREIDLSGYIGQTVYIAFEYVGVFDDFDCGTTWYIDDVTVDELCTGSEPTPSCATISSPPDGATMSPTFTSLFWSPPMADATKQFFYFGTDGGGITTPTNINNGTEYAINTIGKQFLTLTPNTTYYWQIIPANCNQTAVNCPIWSFTTNDGEVNFGGGSATQGGYFWANSTAGASGAPSQPTYSWVDISGTGTDIISSLSDNGTSIAVNIGFPFNFFGANYSQFFINANGFITFTNPSGQTNFGFPLPAVNLPDNLIAGCWKDLDPTNANVTGQHLYYGLNNGNMVITFEHYPEQGGDVNGWITFQIILKPTGNIILQYQTAGSSFTTNDEAIGIENSDGTKGITYKRNNGGPAISYPLAIEFGQSQNALPVELTSFTVSVVDDYISLNWETSTEVNNYGFEIERSSTPLGTIEESENNSSRAETDPSVEKWETIGFVEGHGNSNSPKQYSFVDINISPGKYSYRLKQIDIDGAYEYSEIVEIKLAAPDEFNLSQNYPNPFNPNTKIKFTIPSNTKHKKSNVMLKVYDVLGNEVAILVNEEKAAGNYEVNFNTLGLSSGVYFYTLTAGDFIQTKKMILLK